MKNKEDKLIKNKQSYIKDYWWSFIYWLVLIIIVFDIIGNLNTLQRWKWGYFSIDLIPDIIILIGLYFINDFIINYSRYKELNNRINKIEEFINEKDIKL